MKSVRVGRSGREIRLTNLDKILWPETGFTKQNLLEYLQLVAPFMLPHLKDRPLVTTRYPDGVNGKSFYQKNLGVQAPSGSRTYSYWHRGSDREVTYFLAQDELDLAWLGNLACLEIHPWLSRAHNVSHPDFAVFDLDPTPPQGFSEARRAAFWVRDILTRLGLESYPKTSGATGIHVYVPLDPIYNYDQVVSWVEVVARHLCRKYPDHLTVERATKKRKGVYLDYLQNLLGKTLAGPYSPRPRPLGTVSTPVTWDELESCDPRDFTLSTVPDLLSRRGDPFARVLEGGQGLSEGFEPGSAPEPGPGP